MRMALLGCLLVISIEAHAADPASPNVGTRGIKQRFVAHVQAGIRLFQEQRWDEAIKEYEAAYLLNIQPVLMFNIAQAHRRAQRLSEAQLSYEAFLRDARMYPHAEADPLIPEAEAYVSALRASRDVIRINAEKAEAERLAAERNQIAAKLTVQNELLQQRINDALMRSEIARRRITRRPGFWIGLGVGVVALAGIAIGLGVGLSSKDEGLGLLDVHF